MKLYQSHVAFVGAGPAGTGPLVAALRDGRATDLLAKGARWLEASERIGRGALGDYLIQSDTQSDVLLECIPQRPDAPLADLRTSSQAAAVRRYAGGPLPLCVAGDYLERMGASAASWLGASSSSRVHLGFVATQIHVAKDHFCIRGMEHGVPTHVHSTVLVSSLGGESSLQLAMDAPLPCGQTPRSLCLEQAITTDMLFRHGPPAHVAEASRERPVRVAILGGSHSAYTAAVALRDKLGPENVHIQVLCRRLPSLFYPTLRMAHDEGYLHATAQDVCPITQRVFRLGGLRMQARDLVRAVWGLGARPRVDNVEIVHLPDHAPVFAAHAMQSADLVVLALGYAPRTVPVYRNGERVQLAHEAPGCGPLVDGQCRMRLSDGALLQNAFAMGLASGFVPHGSMGGEPSFRGQTNGLWLYQNDIGSMVLGQVLAVPMRAETSSRACEA